MNLIQLHKRILFKWLVTLTVFVLVTILIVGLYPKDLFPPNHAHWLMDRPGIRFEKSGTAYTDFISDLIHDNISPQKGFSIELVLKPKSLREEGFAIVLLLHGGNDMGQLLVGQWRSSMIVMNGDDYSYSRKIKRISTKTSSDIPSIQFVTVTSDTKGTKIYIDGHQVSEKKDLTLKMPHGRNTRLMLGNSLYLNNPWQGDIYGVAVYGKALSAADIETHFKNWSETRHFSYAKKHHPVIQYNLDEKKGGIARNHISASALLNIPPRMKVLTPNFFFQEWNRFKFDKTSPGDALLNFLGFIPLGFLLVATLIRRKGDGEKYSFLVAFLSGFLVSLLIETTQAWMPERSSDIQDLILNTAGTFVGAMSCRYLLKHKTSGKTEY